MRELTHTPTPSGIKGAHLRKDINKPCVHDVRDEGGGKMLLQLGVFGDG